MTRRCRNTGEPRRHRAAHLTDAIYGMAVTRAKRLGVTFSYYIETLIKEDRKRVMSASEEEE